MTRINNIAPSDLTNEWLLAEFRELPRIPNSIISGKAKVNMKAIPERFKLGTGHVTFFYNKLTYLKNRHDSLCLELDKRGIKRDPSIRVDLSQLNAIYKAVLCNDWQPDIDDHQLLIERLQERFDLRKRAYHMTVGNEKHIINCEHSFNWYCSKFLSKYF